ncbi:MAG: hypothetical protein ABI649_00875 [Gaiellaceae bacterium]
MNPRAGFFAATALAVLALTACGGGSGGSSGGGGGGDAAGLRQEANRAAALLQEVQGLTSITSAEQFALEAGKLQTELQSLIEDVKATDVPDELMTARDKLASRLPELRTSLGSALGAAASADLESAINRATNKTTFDDIQDAVDQVLAATG